MANNIGEMNIVLSANNASFSEAIDQAQRKLNQLKGASQQAGHSTVTSVQAASAALREMNGDITNNIRAVERFITTIPGAGAALKAIFPLAGGLAFGAMIGELGKKIFDFDQRMKNAGQNIRDGFAEITASSAKSGIELAITGDKLENTLAKLEHRPADNLKLALDEDRKAALALTEEVQKAQKELDELYKSRGVTTTQSYLSGFTALAKSFVNQVTGNGYIPGVGRAFKDARTVVSTEDDEKFAKDQSSNIDRVNREATDRLSGATTDADRRTAQAVNRSKQISALDAAITGLQRRLETVRGLVVQNPDRNYEARLSGLEGQLNERQNERTNLVQGYDNASTQQRVDKAQRAKEDARVAEEARRKAAEAQMQGLEQQLAAIKEDHQVSVTEEMAFWERMLVPAQQYPENVKKIHEKLATETQEYYRELDRLAKQAVETQKQNANALAEVDRKLQEADNRFARAQHRGQDARADSAEIAQDNADAMERQRVNIDLATGAITRQDAAIKIAALNAADYAAKLADIEERRKAVNADTSLTDEQRLTANDQLDNQRDRIQGAASRTAASDQLRVFQSTAMGGVISAFQELNAEAMDVSKTLNSFTKDAFKGFNDLLVQGMSTRRFHWNRELSNYGAGLFRQGAGALLGKAEGAVGSMFGIGKLGTTANPMIVKDVSLAGIGGLPSLGQKMFAGFRMPNLGAAASDGESDGESEAQSDGFWGGIRKIFSAFVPKFQGGGDFGAGTMAWVGETGPELVHFGSAGHVTPNSKLPSFSGGGTHIGYIDARGATSPAMVAAQVREGAMAGAQMGRAAAARDRSQEQRRKIGTGR